MTYTAKVLIPQQFVENVRTLKYTSPASDKGTWIDKATFTNVGGSTASVTINIVPAAGTPGDANKVISAKSLSVGETLSLVDLAGKFIGPGDSIHWLASASSAINGAINGREVT